jgi:hypothetical protein
MHTRDRKKIQRKKGTNWMMVIFKRDFFSDLLGRMLVFMDRRNLRVGDNSFSSVASISAQ